MAVRVGPNILVTGHPDGTVRISPDGETRPRAADVPLRGGTGHPRTTATRWSSRSRRGVLRRSAAGGRWGPSAATRRRWPRPPSTRSASSARVAGRRDRHDGHGQPHLGLGAHPRRPAGAGPCRTPAPGSASWRPTTSRTGQTPTRCRSGTSRPAAWQCRSCPFLAVCLPGAAEGDEETETEGKEVTDEEAREAVAAYAGAQDSMKEPEKAKRGALDTLKAWMRRQGDTKATVNGDRTVSARAGRHRYSVNHRKLNEAARHPRSRTDDSHGDRVGVRPGQLDAPPGGSAGRGRLPSNGEAAPHSFETGAQGTRHIQSDRRIQNSWHARSTR